LSFCANCNSESKFPYQSKYFFTDYSNPQKIGFKHSGSIDIYALEINNYSGFLNDNDLKKILQLALYSRSLRVDREIEVADEIKLVLL